jgi:hypothetical protein
MPEEAQSYTYAFVRLLEEVLRLDKPFFGPCLPLSPQRVLQKLSTKQSQTNGVGETLTSVFVMENRALHTGPETVRR